jgi:hypothetical protein
VSVVSFIVFSYVHPRENEYMRMMAFSIGR